MPGGGFERLSFNAFRSAPRWYCSYSSQYLTSLLFKSIFLCHCEPANVLCGRCGNLSFSMPGGGFEPPQLAPYGPQPYVSTRFHHPGLYIYQFCFYCRELLIVSHPYTCTVVLAERRWRTRASRVSKKLNMAKYQEAFLSRSTIPACTSI